MKPSSIMLISLTVLFMGCRKSTEPDNTGGTVSTYPLKAGNFWNYSGTFQQVNFQPAHPGATFDTSTYHLTAHVEIIGEQVLRDSVHTWKFKTVTIEDTSLGGRSHIEYRYYLPQHDTLFSYASAFASGYPVLPKGSPKYRLVHEGRTFSPIHVMPSLLANLPSVEQLVGPDSIQYETSPPKVLVFPLMVGSQWSFSQQIPCPILRKVLGQESIYLPTGLFSTYKIQTLYDIDDNGVWDTDIKIYQYISAEGLIKITELFQDFNILDESGNVIGTVDFKEEFIVTSSNIH